MWFNLPLPRPLQLQLLLPLASLKLQQLGKKTKTHIIQIEQFFRHFYAVKLILRATVCFKPKVDFRSKMNTTKQRCINKIQICTRKCMHLILSYKIRYPCFFYIGNVRNRLLISKVESCRILRSSHIQF